MPNNSFSHSQMTNSDDNEEYFLDVINKIITVGIVPDLFTANEKSEFMNAFRAKNGNEKFKE